MRFLKFVFVAGFMRVRLGDVCEKGSSNLKQSDVIDKNGEYEIYGASGLIGKVDFFHQEKPYIAVVKDGAGIGRTMLLPEKTSVIGTMQYILPNEKVIPKYLYYVIRYMHLEKYFTGATIPHIYFKDYKREEFNLCDLSEQEKIVSTLSKIEKIITHRKQQLEKLDLLVKARFVEMFGEPILNEKGWNMVTIGDIVTEVKYGTSKPAVEGGKYPYLRMNNLTYDGHLDLTNLKMIDIPDSEIEKCIVHRGDVLFNRTNSIELVGKTCVFDKDEDMVIAGYIIRVRLKSIMLPIVLSYFMNTDALKKKLRNMAKGAVNQANINAQEFKSINIYLPPIELQTQFADFVKQVDKSRVAVQKALDETQLLFDSLMQEYFG